MKKNESLVDFFKKSPLVGVDINLERTNDLPREFKF